MSVNATEKPNRLGAFGHSAVAQLPSVSRKRRKRGASKKLRVLARRETQRLAREAGV